MIKVKLYIKRGTAMMYKSKKSNLIVAIILFLIAAIFLVYGIYMVNYSIDYIRTYQEISTISPDNAFQYVVTSSAIYFGFAIVIFIGGMIIFSTRKVYYTNDNKPSIPSEENADAKSRDDDADAHPENNPYYTSPENLTEDLQTPAASDDDATFSREVESIMKRPSPEFEEIDISEIDISEIEDIMDSHETDGTDTADIIHTADTAGTHADADTSGARTSANAVADDTGISDANDASADNIDHFFAEKPESVKSAPAAKPAFQPGESLKRETVINHTDLNFTQQAGLRHEASVVSDIKHKSQHNAVPQQQKKEEHISGFDIKNIFENL